MIQCPNCGTDNMVNAIFCRQCQKKLNLDEISPDDFDDPNDKKGKGSAAARLVVAIIVGLLIAVLILLMIPVKMAGKADNVESDAQSKMDGRFRIMQGTNAGKRNAGKKMTFTNDEATHLLTKALGLPRTGDAKLLPTKGSVAFLDGGKVKIVIQEKAFGKVPFCMSVVAVPTVPSEGTVDLGIKSVSIGLLPMFGPLKEKALKPLKELFEGASQFRDARANAGKLEISADSGTFHFFAESSKE